MQDLSTQEHLLIQRFALFARNTPRAVPSATLRGRLSTYLTRFPALLGLYPLPEWTDNALLKRQIQQQVQLLLDTRN